MILVTLYELELKSIVNDLASNKSPGYDDISPKVIKAVIDSIHLPLCDIFYKSLQTGCFPDNLKIAKVVPIYKGDDKTLVNNYRPISVLSVFSKILEKI